MSIIGSVMPILGSKTSKVVLEISANPKVAGEMVLVVRPMVGPVAETASAELKQLCAALATPIKIIGGPDLIEQEFEAAVNEQTGHRNSWADRAAVLESLIAASATTDANKSGGSADPKAASTKNLEQPKSASAVKFDAGSSAAPAKPFSL